MPKRRSQRRDRKNPWLLIIGGAMFVLIPAVALAFTFGEYGTYPQESGRAPTHDWVIGNGISKQIVYVALIGIGIVLIAFGLKERSRK
jgi:hypothetical protein